MKIKKYFYNQGFSIVELVIVIAIILILAGASTPLLIRYIDRAQKSMDIQTASVIFRAAELAYTSGNDDAYYGYSVCYDEWNDTANNYNGYPGANTATPDGYFYKTSYPSETERRMGYYAMRPIAWCRGTQFSGTHSTWENVLMKSTLDSSNRHGKDTGAMQRKYTDELLWALVHDAAKGETDTHGKYATRTYDGYSSEYMRFRYKRTMNTSKTDKTQRKAECWIVYRRDDNGLPEVWLGYKSGAIRAMRRLYPDPAPDYK
ncbi:MAG: prepilin-type N-terminal cleavage/methylation domain-containing protein [Eubacterium sp.]|nr:prepilin-type N-terminal cleavage/methylation domain-containing protein [Eubacterium sp.]